MNVTALFVELIVVGIGTASWLLLFLAALFSYKFDATNIQNNPIIITSFMAIVYVLGIVVDRLVRKIFMPTIEKRAQRRVFTADLVKHVKKLAPHIKEENLAMELEKFIRANSESLAKKIDYNRSRLRICRAWVIHFLLIGIAFSCWNARVEIANQMTFISVLIVNLVFLMLTWWTTCLLAEDHQEDLLESFEIIIMSFKK